MSIKIIKNILKYKKFLYNKRDFCDILCSYLNTKNFNPCIPLVSVPISSPYDAQMMEKDSDGVLGRTNNPNECTESDKCESLESVSTGILQDDDFLDRTEKTGTSV